MKQKSLGLGALCLVVSISVAPGQNIKVQSPFASEKGRPDGLGGYDLYISYNRNGLWTKAQNLGAPIKSAADELSPKITPDGKYFFRASSRSAIS